MTTSTTRPYNALQKSIQYTNAMHIQQPVSLPASPGPESSEYALNSDDLVPTSALGDDLDEEQEGAAYAPSLVIVGAYEQRITLGRGGSSTVKIGRRNRQISRTHVAIEYTNGRFELAVLGLNGVLVDNLLYRQHERAPLKDYSFVDVLGDPFTFRLPARQAPSFPKQVIQSSVVELEESNHNHNNDNNSNNNNDNDNNNDNNKSISVKETDEQECDEHVFLQETAVSPAYSVDDKQNQQEKVVPVSAPSNQDEAPVQQAVEDTTSSDKESSLTSSHESPLSDHAELASTTQPEDSVANTPSATPTVQTSTPTSENENELEDNDYDDKENAPSSAIEENHDTTDYAENIIDILVFSKKSSMPISDICSRIIKTNPAYKKQDREVWTKRIQRVLKEKAFFGEIVRKGKTADGSPKENLYYYNSDMDPVEWRRATYTQVGRSARKCTLQDKQYFWRIPPKLGKNRNAYIPPPAPPMASPEKRKLDSVLTSNDNIAKKQKQ